MHDDHFEVWHNETGHPSIMSFIGPSVTINGRKNPEYKIYNVASDAGLPESYGRVIDQQTWTSDFSKLEVRIGSTCKNIICTQGHLRNKNHFSSK